MAAVTRQGRAMYLVVITSPELSNLVMIPYLLWILYLSYPICFYGLVSPTKEMGVLYRNLLLNSGLIRRNPEGKGVFTPTTLSEYG